MRAEGFQRLAARSFIFGRTSCHRLTPVAAYVCHLSARDSLASARSIPVLRVKPGTTCHYNARRSVTDRSSGRKTRASRGTSPRATMQARECQTFDEYRDVLNLSTSQLQQIATEVQQQLEAGLKGDSNLLMIPTMVDVIPDGHESGEIFGIEIGGSKLRVLFARLKKERHVVEIIQAQETVVPDNKRHCHADELFDYIVAHLLDFALSIGLDVKGMEAVVIGLCFSFPVQQRSIQSGTLIKWTKGFQNEGAVGKDPGQLLTAAFQRQGVSATVESLINDTVGLLCATRYLRGPETTAAVVVGTGTNACYVEELGKITKWKYTHLPRTPEMVVNVEWASFKSEVLPVLVEDVQLDQETGPGDQAFEKLTAGLYLGDLAVRILLRLAALGQWFPNLPPRGDAIREFSSFQVAAVAQDESSDLTQAAEALAHAFGVPAAEISPEIRRIAQDICRLITHRAARLTAAAISGVLSHVGSSRCIVIAGGGMVLHNGLFQGFMQEALADVLRSSDSTAEVVLAEDSSAAFGAAATAAAAFLYDRTMGRAPDRGAPQFKFPARSRGGSPRAN